MSVQYVHGTQGKPGNEAMSTAYLHFWRLFMSMFIIRICDKLAEMIKMFILLSFKLDTQSWNVHNVPSPLTYWPLKLLTWFYFTIMICYILSPHIKQKYHCTSPLAYIHTLQGQVGDKHKYKAINTSPTHFHCMGYLHMHMLVQTPLSDSPIIVFDILIINPIP